MHCLHSGSFKNKTAFSRTELILFSLPQLQKIISQRKFSGTNRSFSHISTNSPSASQHLQKCAANQDDRNCENLKGPSGSLSTAVVSLISSTQRRSTDKVIPLLQEALTLRAGEHVTTPP